MCIENNTYFFTHPYPSQEGDLPLRQSILFPSWKLTGVGIFSAKPKIPLLGGVGVGKKAHALDEGLY